MLRASDIAAFVGGTLEGPDCDIVETPHFDPSGLVFGGTRILCPRPRLAFARVLQRYFAVPAYSGPSPHAVVYRDRVQMGIGCRIKPGSVLGEDGFGFEPDENGIPTKIPHIGGVVLGDYVEIGALNTVVRGTIEDTVIGNHVKTDDHVHIAHNVRIGDRTLIAACAEISGSVTIGEDVWIAPNCSINDHVSIGDNAFIGIGAVVLEDVPADTVYVGNPARYLRDRPKTRGWHRG